jgi:L-ascorbate metabolism protein UlaG (beta-lactamase superfamily)
MAERTYGKQSFEEDLISTSEGDLTITCIGHGTLMFGFKEMVIHIDPVSAEADYGSLPKADIIFLTHHHQDHLDPQVIAQLRKPDTEIILTDICAREVSGGRVLRIGEKTTVKGMPVEVVPGYNIEHKRPDGTPFHVKGEINAYLMTFADKRVFVGADTEDVPEIRALRNIDVAFLPMNLPYTMTPEMVADVARAFVPRILYPYHFGDTDTSRLVELLGDFPRTEVRIRRLA